MAERQEVARVEGTIVGAVGVHTPMDDLDRATRKQVTLTAYRVIQQACGEDVSEDDHLTERTDYKHHLETPRTMVTAASSPYRTATSPHNLCTYDSVHEGECEVLQTRLEKVRVANTLPWDPCRLMLVATPQHHNFTLGSQDEPTIALAITVSSLLTLGYILDVMCVQNPQLRSDCGFSLSCDSTERQNLQHCRTRHLPNLSVLPIEKYLKKRVLGTSIAHDDEPLKLTRKKSQIYQFTVTEAEATPTPAPRNNRGELVSGHYPLRGQLSGKLRAQDCNSGYYDLVPSGPPRKVDGEEEGSDDS
ncbi:hypothetical protein Hamer_G022271 [Homarus americanus]|uniref:Uncharacterized protein n=1 Tax=Homarus americanus TaxID=6706 RepID=A0A8J5MTR9_HOMAM|nr:hypothetical protein Hamer_G022271 [Homarus americanus]